MKLIKWAFCPLFFYFLVDKSTILNYNGLDAHFQAARGFRNGQFKLTNYWLVYSNLSIKLAMQIAQQFIKNFV